MGGNLRFAERFIEVCGTSEPAKVQRLLNIPYQSAKNYLQGRVPNTDVLIEISNQTSYSIDWMLTGRGKKIIEDSALADIPILTRQFEAIVRKICLEVIREVIGETPEHQPKVVKLHSSELMSEKVLDKSNAPTGRET